MRLMQKEELYLVNLLISTFLQICGSRVSVDNMLVTKVVVEVKYEVRLG